MIEMSTSILPFGRERKLCNLENYREKDPAGMDGPKLLQENGPGKFYLGFTNCCEDKPQEKSIWSCGCAPFLV